MFRSWLLLAVITIACLAPFVTKAFHIDDTLFLWIARQIQTDPLDFYGFTANWYGRAMPMSAITQNPPLTSYYIALVAAIAGWQEVYLHMAFWVPAVGASLGTFMLARHFCRQASLAALVVILSPAFLVSATNVMADAWLLCFFVWAIVAWIYALERNATVYFIVAAVLITLAMLTKYFGVALIPLLLVYSLFRRRRVGGWLVALVIPLVIMTGYQMFAWQLYGRGLLTGAAAYALDKGNGGQAATRVITTLAFAGGSLASAIFLFPFLWTRRAIGMALGLAVVAGTIFGFAVSQGRWSFLALQKFSAGQILQLTLFVVAGLHILALTIADLRHHRDARALLLFLWVTGVMCFTAFVNWSVNVRTILPMAPAVAILVVRRLERRASDRAGPDFHRGPYVALGLAALVALVVTWADFTLAESQRSMAMQIDADHQARTDTTWFQGHWGFQYYMQQRGYRPLDLNARNVRSGDMVVTPTNNANARLLPRQTARVTKVLKNDTCRWLTTMQMKRGAGFYAHVWGPLPFVFGPVPAEAYLLYEIK